MSSFAIVLAIALALAVIVVFYVIVTYNGLVTFRNEVENAWRQIDVQLKRRHDLIPNLVEVVKDYMSYEQEALQDVIAARTRAVDASDGSRQDRLGAEGMLGAALGRLIAVADAYPDLKANTNVRDLIEQLTSTENRIAFARQHFNESVLAMNTRVESFPSNFIAGIFRFRREEYFEVPDAEREPIAVDLR